jgi:hypothetical protein
MLTVKDFEELSKEYGVYIELEDGNFLNLKDGYIKTLTQMIENRMTHFLPLKLLYDENMRNYFFKGIWEKAHNDGLIIEKMTTIIKLDQYDKGILDAFLTFQKLVKN